MEQRIHLPTHIMLTPQLMHASWVKDFSSEPREQRLKSNDLSRRCSAYADAQAAKMDGNRMNEDMWAGDMPNHFPSLPITSLLVFRVQDSKETDEEESGLNVSCFCSDFEVKIALPLLVPLFTD